MNIPSVKTLMQSFEGIDKATALQLRTAMRVFDWDTLDRTIKRYGVEYISRGHNLRSPAIKYINQGDPYTTTIMFVGGRNWVVGCWGNYVERGNYD